MVVGQFLESKPVAIAGKDYLVVEMTASDRVAVMEVAQSLFSSEAESLSIGHQLMLTSLIVQRSLRTSEFEYVFSDSQLSEVPKALSRRILNEVYEAACQLSELDFLLGKPEKIESNDLTDEQR
jgi:hypothetical protein